MDITKEYLELLDWVDYLYTVRLNLKLLAEQHPPTDLVLYDAIPLLDLVQGYLLDCLAVPVDSTGTENSPVTE